jgi:hypothetical protein
MVIKIEIFKFFIMFFPYSGGLHVPARPGRSAQKYLPARQAGSPHPKPNAGL